MIKEIKNKKLKMIQIIKLVCIVIVLFVFGMYFKMNKVFSNHFISGGTAIIGFYDIVKIYQKVKTAAKHYFTVYGTFYTITEVQWKDLCKYDKTLPYSYSTVATYKSSPYSYILTLYYRNDTTYFGSENNFYKYYKPLALEIMPENDFWYNLSYEDERRLCSLLEETIEEIKINSDNPWDYLSYGTFISGTYAYNPLVKNGKIDGLGDFGTYKSFYILCYYDCKLK
jgi:hypothetical protein